MAVQPGLCRTWSKTPKTGFLTTRLIVCLKMLEIRNRPGRLEAPLIALATSVRPCRSAPLFSHMLKAGFLMKLLTLVLCFVLEAFFLYPNLFLRAYKADVGYFLKCHVDFMS